MNDDGTIRIREAQKHVDPDSDPDPHQKVMDPEHCHKGEYIAS